MKDTETGSLKSRVAYIIKKYGEEMQKNGTKIVSKKHFEHWFIEKQKQQKQRYTNITLYNIYSFNDQDYLTLEIERRFPSPFSLLNNCYQEHKYCFCCGCQLPCQEHIEERTRINEEYFKTFSSPSN